MLFTKGRPKAWEAPEDKAGMQGKPAHSWSGDLFFTCSYFQEHKCVFFSWSPVCLPPSSLHWTGLPAVLGCFSLNIFSCFTPCLLLVRASSLVGSISPVMLSQHQLWRQHWFGFLPTSPPTIFYATHFYLCSTSLNIEHILQIRHCAKQFPYMLWLNPHSQSVN